MRRISRKIWIEFLIVTGSIAILFAYTFPRFLDAQTHTINDADHFPDPAFRAAVEKFMGVRPGEPFSGAQAARRRSVLHCGKKVVELSGIRYLKSMPEIHIRNAKVTQVDFSQNPALNSIYISNTPITSLDLSKKERLKNLSCNGLKIANLDVSHNPVLIHLECRANGLTSLDVSACSNLRRLHCTDNALRSIDLSKNPHLRTLSCNNNQLRQLDLSANRELNELFCVDNRLTLLDLSKNPYIKNLICKSNAIEEIISCESPKYASVDCSHNRLKSIHTFVGLDTLYYLNASDNLLDEDDAGDIAALEKNLVAKNLRDKIPIGVSVRVGFER